MNTSIIKRLKKIEIRLNEVLDADLFNVSEAAFDELQSEVSCFEQDLNELLEFHGEHLQFSELKKISSIQKNYLLKKYPSAKAASISRCFTRAYSAESSIKYRRAETILT